MLKDGTNFIIRNNEGKYLMQFRDDNISYNPLKWDFFGETVEDGETPIDCSIRGLYEEIGIDAEHMVIRGTTQLRGNTEHIIELLNPVNTITLKEGKAFGYFTKEEMEKLDLAPLTKFILKNYV